MDHKKGRKLLIRLGCLIIFLVSLIALGELISRLVYYRVYNFKSMRDSSIPNDSKFVASENPLIRYEIYREKLSGGYSLDFNYQPRKFKTNPGPGIFRIIGIGDGHMEGYGGENLVYPLCDWLNNKTNSTKFECLDFGVGGYGLTDKRLLFSEKIINYKPQFVIVQLLDDDCNSYGLMRNASIIADFPMYEVSAGESIPFSIPLNEDVNKFLIKKSYLYRFLSILTFQLHKGNHGTNEINASFRICEQNIHEIENIAKKHNISLLFVLSHTIRYNFLDYPKYAFEKEFSDWFQEINKTEKLHAVFLYDEFRSYNYSDLQGSEKGPLNLKGYALANKRIIEEFRKGRFVSS
jgi:hypothetical protein